MLHTIEFRPEADAEFFSALPAASAVFLLRGEDTSAEPYVSKTSNLRRRLMRLLSAPEGSSRRLNLRDRVRSVSYQVVGGDFEAGLLLYKVLREEFPASGERKSYAERLRLRPAPLIRFILDNAYPRVTVTTKIGSLRGNNRYFGPFASRASAEQFANDTLDFFSIRRCVEELEPHPSHPGCVYSEMKMCMAPCFQGCTNEEYAAETARVERFFESGGQSLRLELMTAREKASEQLEFETAAALHTKLEKLAHLQQQLPEAVRAIDRLDGVMIQPSPEEGCVLLFRIAAGMISTPVSLKVNLATEVGQVKTPQSMESRIAQALTASEAIKPRSAQEWAENLSLLKRWFYRTVKVGELFLTDDKGELPMRRVVRGVSRVFKGEKPKGDLSETAGEYWRFRYGEFQHKNELSD